MQEKLSEKERGYTNHCNFPRKGVGWRENRSRLAGNRGSTIRQAAFFDLVLGTFFRAISGRVSTQMLLISFTSCIRRSGSFSGEASSQRLVQRSWLGAAKIQFDLLLLTSMLYGSVFRVGRSTENSETLEAAGFFSSSLSTSFKGTCLKFTLGFCFLILCSLAQPSRIALIRVNSLGGAAGREYRHDLPPLCQELSNCLWLLRIMHLDEKTLDVLRYLYASITIR